MKVKRISLKVGARTAAWWKGYVRLLEQYSQHIDKEFYSYETVMGVDSHPETPWMGKAIPRTVFRYYYTGETYCVIQAKIGLIFIGRTVCSKKEAGFCKKTARREAKRKALEIMKEVYAIINKAGSGVHLETIKYNLLPPHLQVVNMKFRKGHTVQGIVSFKEEGNSCSFMVSTAN